MNIGLALSDIDDIIEAARRWADVPLALATVIEAAGSAPRQRGGQWPFCRIDLGRLRRI